MPIERTDNKPSKWFVLDVPITGLGHFGTPSIGSHVPGGLPSQNVKQASSDLMPVGHIGTMVPPTIFSADKLKNKKPNNAAFNDGDGYNPQTGQYDYGLRAHTHVAGAPTPPVTPDKSSGKPQDYPGEA